MKIEEFRTVLAGYINDNYDNLTVNNCDTVKNNGVKLYGITLNHGNDSILPTIYLESYLDKYNHQIPIETIAKEIVDLDNESRINETPDLSFYMQFETAKKKLFIKIINTKDNSELLNEVPHRHFLDMALVVYCDMSDVLGMNATTLVRNEHVVKWGVTDEAILDEAYRNSHADNILIRDMMDIIKQYDYPYGCDSKTDSDVGFFGRERMYVMTNEKMMFGAACMVFDDKIDDLIRDRWKGVYIIPSSIHEVIIIPDTGEIAYENLADIIKEVNSTCLSKEEILSENAYYYGPEDGYSIV